jgi:rSAM/selenodomain-associated transferase 2
LPGSLKVELIAPTLAVIIPVLNEAAHLPALLSSLADDADEIIVVDGSSVDQTPAVARSFGCRVALTEPGRGRQLAAGARLASSDLLLFLHADCVPQPGALNAIRSAFDDPAFIAGGMVQHIDSQKRVYRWIERAANVRVKRRGMIYGDSGLVVRRSAYTAAGGFAELPIFEDVEFCRRLTGLGRVGLIDGAGLRISARRWEREGLVACTARNWLLTGAFLFGLEPHRLARHYKAEQSSVLFHGKQSARH